MKKIIIAVVCMLASICTFITSTTISFAASAAIDDLADIACLDVTGDGVISESDYEVVHRNVFEGYTSIATLVKLEKYLNHINYSVIAVNEENTNRIRNWLGFCGGSIDIRHACSGAIIDISDDGETLCRFVFSSGYSEEMPEEANVVIRHVSECGVVYTIWEDGSHYYIHEQEIEFEDKKITEVKFDNPLLANWFYNCEAEFKLREYPDGAIGLSFEDAKSAYILVFEEGFSEMPPTGTGEIIHRHWLPNEKRELIIWGSNDGKYHVSIISES